MIEIRNLSKSFVTSDGPVDALKNVNLTINNGDIYGIIGMSGAGKSTLVRCINMLERPTEGNILLDGRDLGSLNKKELREVRHRVTMIFQGFNLLMQRTCLKNVILPLRLSGVPKAEAEKRGRELLEIVGLPDKANAYPAQLSGGQQQRVAIARAIVTNPKLILADEPTGALDTKTSQEIIDIFHELHEQGNTIVLITHDNDVAKQAGRSIHILDGQITEVTL